MSDKSIEWYRLREQIVDKAVVHGRVVLSSGREADYYVDLRRVTLDGEAAPLVGGVMLDVVSGYPETTSSMTPPTSGAASPSKVTRRRST